MSKPLANHLGVVQGVVLSLYLLSNYIDVLLPNFRCPLFRYTNDAALSQVVCSKADFQAISATSPLSAISLHKPV